MPFNFSFSASTTVVGSTSVNGHTAQSGYAYRHDSFKDNQGSGSRTVRQKLGQAPVTKTKLYDAQGRPLQLVEDRRRSDAEIVQDRRIEDVTEDEEMGGGREGKERMN